MKKDMEDWYRKAQNGLAELREQAESEVVSWVRSYVRFRSDSDYGRLRETFADHDVNCSEDAPILRGYDSLGLPRVTKEYVETMAAVGSKTNKCKPEAAPPNPICVEEFCAHRGQVSDEVRYVFGELRWVRRVTFEDHRVVEEESVNEGFYSRVQFHYESGRLVLQQQLNDDGRVTFETVINQTGGQRWFHVRKDGSRFELGQPLPKGMTIKVLKETIRARLLELIPQIVEAAKINEPIYCVALAYDRENDALPPLLDIGVQSERIRFLTENGKEANMFIWNPAEWFHYEKSHTQIDDDALQEACDLWNGRLAENGSTGPAVKVLVEVAAELNKRPWPGAISRTDDFVVYAVDFELGDLRKNIKAVVSAERFAAMKAKRLC